MPLINVVLSQAEHDQLLQEHAASVAAWPKENFVTAPTFASWLCERMIHGSQTLHRNAGVDDIRFFSAIENLVTSLPQHGINLANTAMPDVDPDNPSQSLA